MAIFAILRPLVSNVPEIVEISNFFWYILRWTRLHKKFQVPTSKGLGDMQGQIL